MRRSGTIISATVSLGYDVPRTRVEGLLLAAAREVELSDPFVHIINLGDFSVTYRIAGLLTEVKQLLSVRSRLRACVVDQLHQGGVEIVSPSFMNTRALAEEKRFIPRPAPRPTTAEPKSGPEEVVFDKAEKAESLEVLRETRRKLCDEIETMEEGLKDLPRGPSGRVPSVSSRSSSLVGNGWKRSSPSARPRRPTRTENSAFTMNMSPSATGFWPSSSSAVTS